MSFLTYCVQKCLLCIRPKLTYKNMLSINGFHYNFFLHFYSFYNGSALHLSTTGFPLVLQLQVEIHIPTFASTFLSKSPDIFSQWPSWIVGAENQSQPSVRSCQERLVFQPDFWLETNPWHLFRFVSLASVQILAKLSDNFYLYIKHKQLVINQGRNPQKFLRQICKFFVTRRSLL